VTKATLDRLTALIEEAHALGKEGHHAAAVPLFMAARELVLLAVDPAALDKEVQRQTGLHRQEREAYRQDILSRAQPRAGNRPLVILSDSLGLPRPDAKATPRKGAEHIYSDLLAGAGGGLRVDALCQRFFTTSDALALLHAEPDLGRDSDVVVHLGLNDCARRMFLERQRIALQLLPPALSERMVDFSRKYRAQVLRYAPPLYYTPPALFASNLDQIITLLKARGAGRIVLTTIILVPLKFWPYTPDVGLFMTEFNLLLMQVAHRHDVRVFDLDRQVWSEFHLGPLDRDGMHLSPHGHEVFAREVSKILGHAPPRPAAAAAGAPASAAMDGKDPSADLSEGTGQPAPVAEDVRRIAILGTSNSIMRQGWTGLFKSVIPKSWTTTNFSIGGSNALFMSGQEAAHEISRTHDLCIIELPINDQRYIDSGYLKPEHFVAAVAGLFKGLMAPGSRCVPLVLSMSQRKTGTLENGADETLAQLTRLCNAYGVPMFDVNDHIRKACAETTREYADFFADGLHLKPVVQRHVATALARMLTDAWPAMPQAQSDLLDLAPAFGVVPARDFVAPLAPEMRKTSLAAMDLACLEHGERMQVHLSGHVCGLMHWADARSEEVVITALDGAQASVQKLLRKEWNWGIFFFTHIFSPIETRKGIEIRSGKNPKLPVEAAINASKLPVEEPPRTEIAFVLYSDRSLDESGRAIAARIKDVPARSLSALDARLVRQLGIIALA